AYTTLFRSLRRLAAGSPEHACAPARPPGRAEEAEARNSRGVRLHGAVSSAPVSRRRTVTVPRCGLPGSDMRSTLPPGACWNRHAARRVSRNLHECSPGAAVREKVQRNLRLYIQSSQSDPDQGVVSPLVDGAQVPV